MIGGDLKEDVRRSSSLWLWMEILRRAPSLSTMDSRRMANKAVSPDELVN